MRAEPDHAVLILTGAPQPEYVKIVGPFESAGDAEVWIAEQGYATQEGTDEWAVVVPWEAP